jgi:hypothetical protein
MRACETGRWKQLGERLQLGKLSRGREAFNEYHGRFIKGKCGTVCRSYHTITLKSLAGSDKWRMVGWFFASFSSPASFIKASVQ